MSSLEPLCPDELIYILWFLPLEDILSSVRLVSRRFRDLLTRDSLDVQIWRPFAERLCLLPQFPSGESNLASIGTGVLLRHLVLQHYRRTGLTAALRRGRPLYRPLATEHPPSLSRLLPAHFMPLKRQTTYSPLPYPNRLAYFSSDRGLACSVTDVGFLVFSLLDTSIRRVHPSASGFIVRVRLRWLGRGHNYVLVLLYSTSVEVLHCSIRGRGDGRRRLVVVPWARLVADTVQRMNRRARRRRGGTPGEDAHIVPVRGVMDFINSFEDCECLVQRSETGVFEHVAIAAVSSYGKLCLWNLTSPPKPKSQRASTSRQRIREALQAQEVSTKRMRISCDVLSLMETPRNEREVDSDLFFLSTIREPSNKKMFVCGCGKVLSFVMLEQTPNTSRRLKYSTIASFRFRRENVLAISTGHSTSQETETVNSVLIGAFLHERVVCHRVDDPPSVQGRVVMFDWNPETRRVAEIGRPYGVRMAGKKPSALQAFCLSTTGHFSLATETSALVHVCLNPENSCDGHRRRSVWTVGMSQHSLVNERYATPGYDGQLILRCLPRDSKVVTVFSVDDLILVALTDRILVLSPTSQPPRALFYEVHCCLACVPSAVNTEDDDDEFSTTVPGKIVHAFADEGCVFAIVDNSSIVNYCSLCVFRFLA